MAAPVDHHCLHPQQHPHSQSHLPGTLIYAAVNEPISSDQQQLQVTIITYAHIHGPVSPNPLSARGHSWRTDRAMRLIDKPLFAEMNRLTSGLTAHPHGALRACPFFEIAFVQHTLASDGNPRYSHWKREKGNSLFILCIWKLLMFCILHGSLYTIYVILITFVSVWSQSLDEHIKLNMRVCFRVSPSFLPWTEGNRIPNVTLNLECRH